jgi:hypothetical protein
MIKPLIKRVFQHGATGGWDKAAPDGLFGGHDVPDDVRVPDVATPAPASAIASWGYP